MVEKNRKENNNTFTYDFVENTWGEVLRKLAKK